MVGQGGANQISFGSPGNVIGGEAVLLSVRGSKSQQKKER